MHNYGALVPNLSRIFGSDFAAIFIEKNEDFSFYTYEVSRVNLTELNSNHGPCTSELDNIQGKNYIAHWSKGYPKNQTPFCIIFGF